MDLLSAGDGSGRPDTSGIDPETAQDYARRMFEAVTFVRFQAARQIHLELNKSVELYVAALDAFRLLCRQRGVTRGAERWREYTTDD